MLAAAILNALPEEEETLEDSLRRYNGNGSGDGGLQGH